MKYIRTKDGIYDLDKSIWCEFTGHKVKMPYCEEFEKQPELCKTADTIEELCDEFVIVDDFDKGINTLWHTKVFSLQEVRKMVKYNEIYGAIWTDKGLIYVAKMNAEGVLCLI